jgi:hypothetical protein
MESAKDDTAAAPNGTESPASSDVKTEAKREADKVKGAILSRAKDKLKPILENIGTSVAISLAFVIIKGLLDYNDVNYLSWENGIGIPDTLTIGGFVSWFTYATFFTLWWIILTASSIILIPVGVIIFILVGLWFLVEELPQAVERAGYFSSILFVLSLVLYTGGSYFAFQNLGRTYGGVITAVAGFLYFWFMQKPLQSVFPFLEHGPAFETDIWKIVGFIVKGLLHLVWFVLSGLKATLSYLTDTVIGRWLDQLKFVGFGTIVIVLILLTAIGLICYYLIYKPYGAQIYRDLLEENNMYMLVGCLLGLLTMVYFAGLAFSAPGWFPRAALFTFFLILSFFCFKIAKSEGAAQNNAIVFACLVLPVIPIFALLFKTANMYVHFLSLIIYATVAVVVIFLNPGGMIDSEAYDSGQIYFVTMLCALALVAVVLNVDFYQEDWGGFVTKFGLSLLSFFILAFGVTMVVNLFKSGQGKAPETIVLLLVVFCAAAFLIFIFFKDTKFRELISFLDYFGTANLLIRTLMVIPCLIADLFAFFAQEWAGWLLLIVELFLIVWYLFLAKPTYSKVRAFPNGLLLQGDPISLRKPNVFKVEHYTYSYALSFWINLKPVRPDETPLATEFVNIVSYGSRPAIQYNASTNTLRVTMQTGAAKEVTVPGDDYHMASLFNSVKEMVGQKPDTQVVKTASNVDVLVADIPNVDLQKWSHFVFYYNDGSLNIFQNGDLITSVRVAATNEASSILVGQDGGNKGQLCSLFFFQNKKDAKDALFLGGEAIAPEKIKSLYHDFKNRTPPVVNQVFKVETELQR